MNTHFRIISIKQTTILFGFNSAYFGNKIKVNFWLTNEILKKSCGIFIEFSIVHKIGYNNAI